MPFRSVLSYYILSFWGLEQLGIALPWYGRSTKLTNKPVSECTGREVRTWEQLVHSTYEGRQ